MTSLLFSGRDTESITLKSVSHRFILKTFMSSKITLNKIKHLNFGELFKFKDGHCTLRDQQLLGNNENTTQDTEGTSCGTLLFRSSSLHCLFT